MQKAYTNSSDASEDDVSAKGNKRAENQGSSDAVAESDLTSEHSSVQQEKAEEKDPLHKASEASQEQCRDESDPVRVLQFSQSVFVSDTLDDDDDGSLIIPPTPEEGNSVPFIIPSTPTQEQDKDDEDADESKEDKEEQLKTDKPADVEKPKEDVSDLSLSAALPTKKLTESPEDHLKDALLSRTETDFTNGNSEDLTGACLAQKEPIRRTSSDENNFESKEAESEPWGLHLSVSEATESLQFLVDEEEETNKSEIEDGITQEEEEDMKMSTLSSDAASLKEKSLKEADVVEPDIEDEEPKKAEVELPSSESVTPSEKPVFLIDTPDELNVPAATEKSITAAADALFAKIQSLAQDSKASKPENESVKNQNLESEKGALILSEEPAFKDDDLPSSEGTSSSADLPSLKTQIPDTSVVEKLSDAEKEMTDTGKEKSSLDKKEDLDFNEGDMQAKEESSPPALQAEIPLDPKRDEESVVDEENQKAQISQSTEKTQSDIDTSQEFPQRTRLFSFTDVESLVQLCGTHIGRKPKDPESIVAAKPGEKVRVMITVHEAEDKEMFKTVYTQEEFFKLRVFSDSDISPHTSVSTISRKSLPHSLTSGDLADISSSFSSKSTASSGLHYDMASKSSQTLSSCEASQDSNLLTRISSDIRESRFITSTRMSPIKSKSNAREDLNNKKMLQGRRPLGLTSSSNDEAQFVKPENPRSSKRSVGRKRRNAKDVPPDGSLLPTSAVCVDESTPLKRKNETSSNSSSSSPSTNKKNTKKYAKKKRKVGVPEENLGEETPLSTNTEVEMPVLVEEEDPNLSSSSRILPGVRVMARWKDGYYYPGEVVSQDRGTDNCWCTKFDDGALHSVPEENMIKIAQLSKDTSVLVKSPDGFFDPGIIKGYYRETNESGYIVEQDNGLTKRFPRSAVILSSDQANLALGCISTIISPSSAVSLDNIVSGKRKRTPVLSAAASPALRARLKRKAKNPDPNLDSTAESSGAEMASGSLTPKMQSRENKRTALVSTNPFEPSPKPQENASSSDADVEEEKKETSKLSSIVSTGKKIFEGYAFFLSEADQKSQQTSEDSEVLIPSSETSSSSTEVSIESMDKKYISSLIETEGGTVYQTFEECQRDPNVKNVFLLAKSHLRTIKYIQCLATGTPCVQFLWITGSCNVGTVLDYKKFILPAGLSILEDQEVEWHGKSDALKGLKVLLIGGKSKDFVEVWTPVLLAAKVELVQKTSLTSFSVKESSTIDIVVTDASCPKKYLVAAERSRIPVVSSEWVIQCLICGFRLPHDAHPKFIHNYVE